MNLKIFIKKEDNKISINGKNFLIPKGKILENFFYFFKDVDPKSINKIDIKLEKQGSILSKRILEIFKKTLKFLKSLEN